jgi:nucleotide-binding universal stress UspA family protein
MHNPRLIVGTDGSPPSLRALRWAAREAQRRGVPLTVLVAYTWRTLAMRLLGDHAFEEYIRDLALSIVDAAVAEARTVAPRAHVHGSAVFGEPAPVLLHASDEADMVVVGNRSGGAGGDPGSVSAQVATRSSCPMTAVIRGRDGRDTGPVVVGVDGTASADFATGIAFEEAARRSCALMAVLAYDRSAPPWPVAPPRAPLDRARIGAERETALLGQVTEWRDKYPEVPVGYVVSRGRPAAVLTSWSRQAQLVVVGGHGRRTGRRGRPGGVDVQLIHRADCPVLIARTNSYS